MTAGGFHHAHLMGDDDDGDAELAVDIPDQLQNGAGGLGVEGAGGFIAQQHFGVGGKRAGNGDTLLLTARKLGRVGGGFIAETHQLQQGLRLFDRFGFFYTGKLQREADIAQAVFLHQQVKALKNHGDASTFLPQLPLGHLGQVMPVNDHAAGGGAFQHIDASDEGAFAGTAHADDAEHIAIGNGERYITERLYAAIGKGVGLT